METITGNAERSDAGTSDASGLAEATALEATNASDATATTPDAPVAFASEAANAEKDPSRVGSSEPPRSVPSPLGKTAEPASPVSGATADAARDDADRDSPRVLSPTSKWRVLRTRVRAMSFVERVGKMAAHARPSTLQARAALPNGNLMNLPNVIIDRMSISDAADGVDTATFTFTGALDVPDAELDRDISRVLLRACLVRGGELVGAVAAVPGTRTTDADGVAAWRFGRESRESLSRPAIEPLTVAEMMASPSGSGGEGGKTEDAEDAEDDAYHLLARADRGVALSRELRVELNVVPAVGGDGTRGVSRDASSLSSDSETETETETERSWFGAPPASFPKKPPLVSARRPDEICVAWGRVPWPDAIAEKKSGGNKKKPAFTVVDVALRGFGGAGGSDAISPSGSATDDPEGVLLPASAKAKASSAGFFRKFTEKAKRLGRGPTVRVRVAAPPPPHAAAAAKLPRETLCASRFVPLLATFRELREREARAARETQNVSSSPALTAIPACLRDEHLADALADAFRRARLKKVKKPSLAKTRETRDETDELVEVLETLALKFWALTRTGALRDARVDAFASGDAEARRRRARVIEKSVSQHPHKSLSREPDGWCHEPFSVAELRHVFA